MAMNKDFLHAQAFCNGATVLRTCATEAAKRMLCDIISFHCGQISNWTCHSLVGNLYKAICNFVKGASDCMRLKQIKLAGFKSFVDATTVTLPGNRCAVVGPNGCGKSNIIDAVRWVMGESSAKNLRGESMTDVIFNGSVNRKPVGQASIELVFDNTAGKSV